MNAAADPYEIRFKAANAYFTKHPILAFFLATYLLIFHISIVCITPSQMDKKFSDNSHQRLEQFSDYHTIVINIIELKLLCFVASWFH